MEGSAPSLPRSELFLDGNGQLVEYARRAHLRLLADSYFLARWRSMGPQAAGLATCERFGHPPLEVRGGLCERCGQRPT